MRPTLILLSCLLAVATAQAQQSASYSPEFDARERARIAVERQQTMERHGREEADCYQRFAVNDCLREVRKRRRVSLEELRRQELILNDERRAAAAAAQQRRVDERAAERGAPQEAGQREAAQKAYEERLERAREKQAEQQSRPAGAAPAPGGNRTPSDGGEASRRRLEQQRAYEEKQRRAEERRQARERAQSEKGPNTSRPLPVPP